MTLETQTTPPSSSESSLPIGTESRRRDVADDHNHQRYQGGALGMPRNARKHPREEVTLRVDYMDAEGRSGLGLARNLSYTGIALTSLSRPLQVGDTLVLTFVTSTRKACKLHARVVHTLGASVGLVFTDAKEAYRQLLGAIAAAFPDTSEDAPLWRTSHRSLRVRG